MQQDAQPRQCVVVHATFTEFGDAGKRWRFMEAGLWGALPQTFFSEGHYLTFEPPVPPDDPAPCAKGEGVYVHGGAPPRPCGGEDPSHTLPRPKRWGDVPGDEGLTRSLRLRQNLELMRRQLHALRDALAVALLLNRTLVLPHFDCLCDRSELVDYIPWCVFPGAPSTLRFPRKCSTHFVLNIHKLLYMNEPLAHGFPRPPPPLDARIRLRAHAFLHDPRTAAAITTSSATVAVRGPPTPLEASPRCSAPHDRNCRPPLASEAVRRQLLASSDALKERQRGVGTFAAIEAELPRGASDAHILSVLGTPAIRRTRVLRLTDAEGLFGAWEAHPEVGRVFNLLETYFLFGGDFCCTSRRANDGRL